jgi:hypothetical protein
LALALVAAFVLQCAPALAVWPFDGDYDEDPQPDPDDPNAPSEDEYAKDHDDEKDSIMDKVLEVFKGLGVGLLTLVPDVIKRFRSDSSQKDDQSGQDAQNATEIDADKAKAIFDAATFGTLLIDAVQAADELGVENQRYESYRENYNADHLKLDGGIFSSVNDYDFFMGSHTMTPGFRRMTPGDVAYRAPGLRTGVGVHDVYSAAYKSRRGAWQSDMNNLRYGNWLDAGSPILETVTVPGVKAEHFIKVLDDASFGAKGYMELIQAGAESENYMNRVMLHVRQHTIRQADAQLRLWIEKIQDGADEVSAFGEAVGAWRPASAVPGKY